MSELVVVSFDDQERAQRLWDELRAGPRDISSDLEDGAVLVHHTNGNFEVRAGHRPLSDSVSWSHLWGYLTSLMLMVPIVGIPAVAATNSLLDRSAEEDSSITAKLRDQIRSLVPLGSSALLAVIRTAEPEAVTRALASSGGKIVRIPLSDEDEGRLQESIYSRGIIG